MLWRRDKVLLTFFVINMDMKSAFAKGKELISTTVHTMCNGLKKEVKIEKKKKNS